MGRRKSRSLPFRVKSGGGDAGEITGGLTFDGLIDDEIIVDVCSFPTLVHLTASGEHNTIDFDFTSFVDHITFDWGDGNIESFDGFNRASHTYSDDGDYTVTMMSDKTNKVHIYGGTQSVYIAGVEIGTQYSHVKISECELANLFVPRDVDVTTGYNADVASVVYEDGTNEIGEYDHINHQWRSSDRDYFGGCESLTSVTIPDSIKTIDPYSFNNTPYKTANTANYCFTAGKVAVIAVDAENKSVVIPNTVKYINPWFSWQEAQAMQYNLSGVTFGSAVEEIGDYAFHAQRNISSLTLPSTLVRIGDNAFYGCSNLATVTLSSNLLTIGSGAFNGCKITSVTFPATVTSIGANAFKGNKLTNIAIPATVTSIGADAFANNSTLTEIHFAGSTPPTITAAIAPNTVYILVPVGAVSAYEAAGYANVHEEGWTPPQYISLTWVTGGINATTGVDKTDSNSERSNSTAAVASEVYSVEWRNPDWRLSTTQFMICCYNKSDGTYAGTYNGTTVTKSETHIHEFNSSDPIDYDLTSLNSQYDFRFVVTGQWGTQSGQGQDIKVYGLPI